MSFALNINNISSNSRLVRVFFLNTSRGGSRKFVLKFRSCAPLLTSASPALSSKSLRLRRVGQLLEKLIKAGLLT